MTRSLYLALVPLLLLAGNLDAQTSADSAAIRQAALDYIEGWYEGNAERMERALHPDLAKRIINVDQRGRSVLVPSPTREQLHSFSSGS